jgi:small GTP-binding protein
MGNEDKKLVNKLFVFGIDKAGKSSIVNTLKGLPCENLRPTLSFSLINFIVDDMKFQIWDAPGQKNLRRIWNNGFNRAKFLVFVLDTTDIDRFEESHEVLNNVLSEDDVKNIPLIFCFHKWDLNEAKDNINKAENMFNLSEIKEREVIILKTSIYEKESIDILKNAMVDIARKMKAYKY